MILIAFKTLKYAPFEQSESHCGIQLDNNFFFLYLGQRNRTNQQDSMVGLLLLLSLNRDNDGDLSEQEFVVGAVEQVKILFRNCQKRFKNCEIWILMTSEPFLYIFYLRGQKCFPILQAEFRDRLGKVVRLEEAPLYRMSSCY